MSFTSKLGIQIDRDAIAEARIDEQGRLYVMPLTITFPYVYREAAEVKWDDNGHYLYAPPPPRSQLASNIWWFRQILSVARAQDCDLHKAPEARWSNISQQLKEEILAVLGERHA